MYRTLQYQIKAEPVLVPTAVISTPTYINSQACEPTSITHFQYQANAEPVFVSGAAPETITSDKWLVRTEQPRQDIKRRQWLSPSFFAEKLNSVPVVATPLYVSGSSAEPISLLSFQYQGVAKPVFTPSAAPETVTADKWLTSWPQPTSRPRRLAQYGVNCAIAEQADEGLPPIYWFTQANLPLRSKSRIPLPQNQDLRLAILVETIRLDKWAQETQRPRFDPKRQVWLYPAFSADTRLHISPSAEVVRLDKWGKNYPDLISRARRLTEYIQNVSTLRQIESAVPLSWYQPQPLPRRTLDQLRHLFPALAIDAAFFVVPTGAADYLSPAKNIASAILYTSHLGTGVLFVSHSDSGDLQVGHVDASELFTDSIGTEP